MTVIESFVDVRHAGGAILVDADQDHNLFAGCVRLEIPDGDKIPLYPHEARALAAALIDAARHSEHKNAPDALQRTEGGTETPNHHQEVGEPMNTTLPDAPVRVLCDRCVDATYPRRDCPDCVAETARELHRMTEPGQPEHNGIGGGL